MWFKAKNDLFRHFYRIVLYLSYRVEIDNLYLVLPISTSTYLTSFESVINDAKNDIFFVSRVVDDISPTSTEIDKFKDTHTIPAKIVIINTIHRGAYSLRFKYLICTQGGWMDGW